MKKLFDNTMDALSEFTDINNGVKENIFTKLKNFTERATALIDKLEIGNLNQLYQMGKYVTE